MPASEVFESVIQHLINFGEVDVSSKEQKFWPNYSTFIMDRESSDGLLHILAHTRDLYCKPHNWYIPIHAARICALNQNEEALPWLIEGLITTDLQDDWAREIIFEILPLYKEKLLVLAKDYLFEEPIFPQELWGHIFLVDIIRRIGLETPDCRAESIHLLNGLLKEYRYHPLILNNVLIDDLCLLGDEASISLMHEVCENQFVPSPEKCWREIAESFNLQPQDLFFEKKSVPLKNPDHPPGPITDSRLRKILATLDCVASLEELKAVMAGALCSRTSVSLKTVCDTVLVNNENKPLTSESPAQFQSLVESVTALWGELLKNSKKIKAGDSGTIFEPHIFSTMNESQIESLKKQFESSPEETQVLMEILFFTVKTELNFFLKGVKLGENKNLSGFIRNIQNQLNHLNTFLNTHFNKTKDLQSQKNTSGTPSFLDLENAYQMILNLKTYWRENYILFVRGQF
ncbi:MAG: hypothetical protein ACXVB1_17060 [Pseudobdellovibrionaceae bacterium]